MIRIPWQKTWIPSDRFPHQMGIPTEVGLVNTVNGLYLVSNPVEEIKQLYVDGFKWENFELKEAKKVALDRAAYDMHIVAEFKGEIHLNVFGHLIKFKASENLITYVKPQKNYRDARVPVSLDSSLVDIRVVVDRCSFELFIDGGKINVSLPYICDYNLPYLTISATEIVQVEKFECHKLSSIHKS